MVSVDERVGSTWRIVELEHPSESSLKQSG